MKSSNQCSYIGIAYCGGQKPLAFASLDERQKIQALGLGRFKDIQAFIAGQSETVVACGLPLNRPSSGDCRPVEAELQQRGLPAYHTSAEPQSHHPAAIFGIQMAALFQALDFSYDFSVEKPRIVFESHPGAAFQVLLGRPPFASHSLEGRLQRQLVLFERQMPINDPMDFFEEVTRHKLLHGILPTGDLYTSYELDALVLAHTAWLKIQQTENILTLGDSASGQVLLPQPF